LATPQRRRRFLGTGYASENSIASFPINHLARQIMTTYNLLFIDTYEHIGRSAQIECLTDERAMEAAALEAGDHRAIQIWDGERPIAKIGNPRNRTTRETDLFQWSGSAAILRSRIPAATTVALKPEEQQVLEALAGLRKADARMRDWAREPSIDRGTL
jgi:hypothetical protein